MRLLVSACLLGLPCRYDGGANRLAGIESLLEQHECIPVCPEQLGGLCTPRSPAECREGRVFTREGAEVTAEFERGAQATLELARLFGCEAALLKERSPSCGSGVIHDGGFSGGLTAGDGVTAALLKAEGIAVYGETRVEELPD
ncbi:DUF523 domain-containing protein [Oscillibacter sp.]|uniref:DUF523 domain-containing protein n=1 Tax=Oscillibacter sp. TaxID=1945593 RepID=UPI0028A6BA4D|nr:DUF523 domain-containing protein [Oscillibacter sp.]